MMHFADAATWDSWLTANHATADDAWLKIAKKGSDATSITIVEALEVALCHGWIDSHRKALDDHFYLQRYSRRRKGGSWSQVNVDRVRELTAAGRMRAPGLAEVAAAKADGRWAAAYTAQRDATVPPDLAQALKDNPQAATAFHALDKTARYRLILPLLKARTPATRATRLNKTITDLLAIGTAHKPGRQRP